MISTTLQTTTIPQNIDFILRAVENESSYFVIEHGAKTVAYLLPESLLKAMLRFTDIDKLEQADPGLADTIALMFNPEVMGELEESFRQYKAGEIRPIQHFFDDIHASSSQNL